MSKWEFVELCKLCDLEKGKTGLLKAKEGKYPLVATGKDRRTCDTYQFDTKAVCIPLVSSTGHGHASLKYVHYQEGKFALGTILVAVIPKDENILNAQFLHLYLSRLKDTVLVPLMTGAANVTLTVTRLKTVKIPLAPIEEQLKIVSLFNRMDNEQTELTNEIQTQQTLLKKLRQSILQEAIEGKLTASWREQNPDLESASKLLEKIKAEKEQLIKAKKIKKQKPLPPISEDEIPFDIPDEWVWCYLSDYSINRDENRIPISRSDRDRRDKIYDYYGASGVIDKIDGFTHEGTFLLIGEDGANLVARSTPIAFIASGKFWVNNHAHILEFLDLNSLKYIEKYVNAIDLKPYITGGFQPKLSQGNLSKIKVALPPIEEQKQIVKKIETLFAICDKLEEQIEVSKSNSEMLMQSVLKEAFEQKESLTADEEAMVMMSYIIDSIRADKLGRVKLQKIISMHIGANNLDYGFEFKRCAMGPYDKKRMNELERKIEEARWFKKDQENGDKGRIYYTPLKQKDHYKEKLVNLPYKRELENLIDITKPLTLSQSEIVATLFSVYLEEKKSSLIDIDNKTIITKAKNWHEAKQQYMDKDWQWGMDWLKLNGLISLDD